MPRKCWSPTHLGSGRYRPSASQEFLITLTNQPPPGAGLTEDPVLRNAVARHRCRLTVLDDTGGPTGTADSTKALTSFTLCRRRVRITGPDEAAIRRCCRLLAARFPAFADRSGLAPGRRRDRLPSAGIEVKAGLLGQRCRLGHTAAIPLSLEVSRGPIDQLQPFSSNHRRWFAPAVRGDDSYSAFFTESLASNFAETQRRSPSLRADAATLQSFSVTCTTVTLSVDEVNFEPANLKPASSGNNRGDHLSSSICARGNCDASRVLHHHSSSSRSHYRRGEDCNRRCLPKITHAYVQTTPGVQDSGGNRCSRSVKVETPEQSSRNSNPSNATAVTRKVKSSSLRPSYAGVSFETKVITHPPPADVRRLRANSSVSFHGNRGGRLAHKRITWFLKWPGRNSKRWGTTW